MRKYKWGRGEGSEDLKQNCGMKEPFAKLPLLRQVTFYTFHRFCPALLHCRVYGAGALSYGAEFVEFIEQPYRAHNLD